MLLLIIGGVGMPNHVIGSLIISLPMQLTMSVMCIMPFDQLGLAADALEAQHEVELDRNVLACLMAGLLVVLDRDRFFDDERTDGLVGATAMTSALARIAARVSFSKSLSARPAP
ncbi:MULTISPECIES: hypothetical protein [unclassified Bradyrhizobium]|uniref:hypothetical protein n=1 Tax=unclassified Bradyrhizobium TaxID=2631580 RepID=UPI001CD597D2|nr:MULTISPECIES: hypothetical protein [unclassified Bradyrhizobium]MCA1385533.1 hypothetical protein [Bradyrhizobium sp. BRP05]MCA1393683.1 hypothetical protein [Bradyrhizobium sp. IC3123]MCA1422746.1 hypothetical protein [Bradyrhizobium sp. BRP23]MCA1429183.1 hypothetical protein [Bradyrhizobium sp. NBAIM16]MCA1480338.1 hypothetical protein [Bradyrhizobium sp. NBAIM08]